LFHDERDCTTRGEARRDETRKSRGGC
jgi:hypothetical protein